MIKAFNRYTKVFKGIRLPWVLLFLVVALSMVKSHVEVETVTLTASIIDGTENTIRTDELIHYVEFLLLSSVISIANNYISGLAYQKINLGVRLKLWNKMMRLPTKYYDSDNGSSLVTRVTTDADNASNYFQLMINLYTAIYAGIVAYQKMFSFQASLATASLLIIPLTFGIAAVYGVLSYKAGAKSRNRLAATMGYLAERVRGMRLMKSFQMMDKEQAQADELFKKQCSADIQLSLVSMIQLAGMEIIGCISIIISFVMGGKLVSDGVITVGTLIGFYSLSGLASIRLVEVFSLLGSFAQNTGVMQKIGLVLEASEEPDTGYEMDVKDEDLNIKDLSFSYGGVPVLKEISCTIPKGKVTAVVGTNGAGKTTLFKLLERMYHPESGEICFGETNIKEFSLSSWRKSFAIVAQDKPLLSGTIRENILYGVERAVSEEELCRVAKMANIYEFVMETPGGFDAQVGPGGSNFSGGQQQCIAIARAMMRNPDYLLLDEATSNLDVKSEKQVTEALQNLMKGRTTVLIAHNYSAAQYANQVIVMNQGQIEAFGTPEELLKSNEYYRAFAKKAQEEKKQEGCQ